MRNDVENIIKEFHLDRKRIFEVSKFKYASIIHQIEKTFVKNGQHIHWSNMGCLLYTSPSPRDRG